MGLPSGYKRLEYIQSSGTQYVDSGFKPNQNTRVIMDVKLLSQTTANIGIFGVRDVVDANAAKKFIAWSMSTGSSIRSDYFGTYANVLQSTSIVGNRIILDKNKNICKFGSVVLTNTSATGQCTKSIYLLCTNDGGTPNYHATANLYSCQIYDNGTMIRDYIPCQTVAGDIGLWDDVNSVFYGNAGKRTFTAGPVIAIAADKSKIKKLKYIQSSGTQWIDSGVVATQSIGFEIDFSTENAVSTSGHGTIFGVYTASRNRYEFGTYPDTSGGKFLYGGTINNPHLVSGSRIQISFLNNVLTTPNGSENISTQTFNTGKTFAIFGRKGENNGVLELSKTDIYALKFYDNGTLVRDFIPCQKPDGAIGLWDDVNSVFYGNAGTGTFTAGPVVVVIPEAPSNLQQTMSVRLIWAEVYGAEQYNVYRDDTLLGTTTGLFYVDDTAAENTEYTYAVSAVNSAGESPKTTISVYTKTGYFLYKPYIESATFQ